MNDIDHTNDDTKVLSESKHYNGLISFSFNPPDMVAGQHYVASLYLPDFYEPSEIGAAGRRYVMKENKESFIKILSCMREHMDTEEISHFQLFWGTPPFDSPTYYIATDDLITHNNIKNPSDIKAFIETLATRYHGIALETLEISSQQHSRWDRGQAPHPLSTDQYMKQLASVQHIILEQTTPATPTKTPLTKARAHL